MGYLSRLAPAGFRFWWLLFLLFPRQPFTHHPPMMTKVVRRSSSETDWLQVRLDEIRDVLLRVGVEQDQRVADLDFRHGFELVEHQPPVALAVDAGHDRAFPVAVVPALP